MTDHKNKRLTLDIPKPLYQEFIQSKLRKRNATDSEAIRDAIKQVICDQKIMEPKPTA